MNTTKKSLLWLLPILCVLFSIAVYATSAQEEAEEKAPDAKKPAFAGNYEAYVWLRVAKSRPKILFDREVEEHYLNDREAQPTLIRSGFVLREALQQPGIADLGCLKGETDDDDKVAWLIKNLKVGYLGDSEILAIAIKGKNPDELKAIVAAVRDAYLDRVVGVDRELDAKRMAALQQAYDNVEKAISEKRILYRTLTQQLGVPDSEAARQAGLYALETIAKLRDQVNQLRAEINGLERKIVLLEARLKEISEKNKTNDESQSTEYHRKLALNLLEKDAGVTQLRFELASKNATVKALAEQVENPDEDPELAAMREQVEEAKLNLQTRAKELMPLIEDAVFQIMRAEKAPTRPEETLMQAIAQAETDKAVYQAQLDSYMKAFQQAVTSAEKYSDGSIELAALWGEVERLETMYHQMGTTLDEWKIESAAAKRVTIINEPAVMKVW